MRGRNDPAGCLDDVVGVGDGAVNRNLFRNTGIFPLWRYVLPLNDARVLYLQ